MWLVLMMSLVLLLRLKLVSYLDVGLFAAFCCCLGGFLGKSTQLLGNVFQFLIFKCATMPPYSAAWRHTFSIWRMPGILSFFFVCRWNDTNSWQRIWQEFLWGFAMQPAQAPSIIWSWISSGSFLFNWNWTNKASQTNLFIDISLQFNPIWPSLPAYPWTKAWGGTLFPLPANIGVGRSKGSNYFCIWLVSGWFTIFQSIHEVRMPKTL